MQRREFLAMNAAAGLMSVFGGPAAVFAEETEAWCDLFVADPHAHPEYMVGAGRFDPTMPSVATLKSAGVALCAFAAVGDLSYHRRNGGWPFRDTKEQLRRPKRLAEQGALRLVLGRDDLAALTPAPEVPFGLMAIEGGDALEGQLENLEAFFQDGVRMITLIHDRDNELGFNQRSGSDGPLTSFGVQVVERMNELGMLIDVAHANTATMKSITERSTAPVIDSHTSPFLPDEEGRGPRRLRSWQEMEWVAKTGGVICTWPLSFSGKRSERTTLAHWADEIVRMKSRLGIEHCGLGTDGGGGLPQVGIVKGWNSIASWPALAVAMLEAGLSRNDLAAFFGGNFRRLLEATLR